MTLSRSARCHVSSRETSADATTLPTKAYIDVSGISGTMNAAPPPRSTALPNSRVRIRFRFARHSPSAFRTPPRRGAQVIPTGRAEVLAEPALAMETLASLDRSQSKAAPPTGHRVAVGDSRFGGGRGAGGDGGGSGPRQAGEHDRQDATFLKRIGRLLAQRGYRGGVGAIGRAGSRGVGGASAVS